MISAVIFSLSYIGIALGKIPGITLDRTGIALLGAIGMVAFGVITPEKAFAAIDLPTILLLYSLMIISAQLRLGGFYTWIASKTALLFSRPKLFLGAVMAISALLSAILANDIICFSFTPVLASSLIEAKLNPLPYLIGLAVSSNIGSAATLIGNPQNMLLGQVGHIPFDEFLLWCGPPSCISLIISFIIILLIFRKSMHLQSVTWSPKPEFSLPVFNSWQSAKGIIAVVVLVTLFFTAVPREISAVSIAGLLLCSRRMKTREILGLVDWHLITLFCALFILIQGISSDNHLHFIANRLKQGGMDFHNLTLLAPVTALLSNIFSNVPAVMMLIPLLDHRNPEEWYTLAVSSTFAGNFLLMGSIANLIVVEQAEALGIQIRFKDHARVGMPVTLVSLLILILWDILW